MSESRKPARAGHVESRGRGLLARLAAATLGAVLLRVVLPDRPAPALAVGRAGDAVSPEAQPGRGVQTQGGPQEDGDRAPGDHPSRTDEEDFAPRLGSYLIGLCLAVLLTAASFLVARYGLVWKPGVPILLVVLAIAQMGVHLVFFLHINTGPDNTNNVMALAFGTFIVILLIGGSLWIMANLNHNMMPMDEIMKRQR